LREKLILPLPLQLIAFMKMELEWKKSTTALSFTGLERHRAIE
jgi:hypothetical protein